AAGHDHIDPAADQIDGEPGHAVVLIVGPAILDRDVAACDIAAIVQALVERRDDVLPLLGAGAADEADHRTGGVRIGRPCGHHGTAQSNELSPVHVVNAPTNAGDDLHPA